MGAEMAGYTPGGLDRGPGREDLSTEPVAFNGHAASWFNLLPTVTSAAGSANVLVEDINDHGPILTVDGKERRVRTAWRAFPDRVFVAHMTRSNYLSSATCEDYLYTGWDIEDLVTYRATAAPIKTYGLVPVQVGDTTDPVLGAGVRRGDRLGARAQGYLPAPVRASVQAAVPEPELWTGDIYQGGLPSDLGGVRQYIRLLRLARTGACVVNATRSDFGQGPAVMAATDWAVTMYVYTFAPALPTPPAPAAVDAKPRRRLLGRR